MKVIKIYSPKHQVTEQPREGMPIETSAECLTDRTLKTTNAFRKECWRSRAKVFVPTQKSKVSKLERKVGEKSFKQLAKGFRRSYVKRFKHIPKRFLRFEKIKATADAETARQITTHQNSLKTIAEFHDQHIILINREIVRRHFRRLT